MTGREGPTWPLQALWGSKFTQLVDLGTLFCVCVSEAGRWKGLCNWATGKHTRTFLDLIESPRVAILSIPGAEGSLNPRAGFGRGNLGGTALTEREVRKVRDILDMI